MMVLLATWFSPYDNHNLPPNVPYDHKIVEPYIIENSTSKKPTAYKMYFAWLSLTATICKVISIKLPGKYIAPSHTNRVK